MSAVLKHWREASTLILITARHRDSNVKPNFVSSSDCLKGTNFEVLLLKRSAKSKFMPNLYVFPGGVASDADFSADWIPIFDLLGENNRKNMFDFFKRGGQAAPMFNRLRDVCFTHIPSEIAFRICAIRETFEESGVLIARRIDKEGRFRPQFEEGESWASCCQDISVISEWRKRVESDPSEFLRMCNGLQMVPDVWSLYEWCNWLTPVRASRRFDTAFFVCCVESKPHAVEDEGETVHSQWGSPAEIVKQYYQARVKMAPPQIYELLRLTQFSSLSELLKFAWQRGQHRVDRWLPVRVHTSDTVLETLPGDSLYPADVDPENSEIKYVFDKPLAQLSDSQSKKHRLLLIPDSRAYGEHLCHVVCNISLSGGHISPPTSVSGLTLNTGPKL